MADRFEEHEAARFGRIADDGSVYLITPDGERQIGVWRDGTTEEGIARFVGRYMSVARGLDALDRMLEGAAPNVREATERLQEFRTRVEKAPMIGDMDALTERLDRVASVIESRLEHVLDRRAEIVIEAERLVTSDNFRNASRRMQELFDEWRGLPRRDRVTEDELWGRFTAARNALRSKSREHAAKMASRSRDAKAAKEELIAQAERLADSSEWGPTTRRLRDLMTQWKAAGSAGRGADDDLWARFRAAQDAFFARRGEADESRKADLDKIDALAAEASALLPITDAAAATRRLREIRAAIDAIGEEPREDADRKLRDAEVAASEARGERIAMPSVDAPWRARFEQALTELEERVAKARSPQEAERLQSELDAKRLLLRGG